MSYILSIVIPTKNRYFTLFNLIDSILSFNLCSTQIVIHDNSNDNTDALRFLKSINNSNICYKHSTEKLDVIQNFDKAIKLSSGKYICLLGDDDAVMPYIESVALWMHNNKIQSLKSNMPVYFWPGLKLSKISNEQTGVLRLKKIVYQIKKKSCINGVHETLRKGGTDMSALPFLYHGIVSKIELDKIFNKCGTFFPGPSPDMASSIAIALETKYFHYLGFPLIISGKCINSTGGEGVLGNHVNRIEDVEHLPKNTSKEWNSNIPKYWTGPTIWAQSVFSSLEKIGAHDQAKFFNFDYLISKLFVYNYSKFNQISKNFTFSFTSRLIFHIVKLFSLRLRLVVLRKFTYTKKITGVVDIKSAIDIIMKNIDIKTIKSLLDDGK